MSESTVLLDLQGEMPLPEDVSLADIVPSVAGTALASIFLEGATVAPVDGGGLRITADLPDLHLHGVVVEIPPERDGVRVDWAAPGPLGFANVEWLALADAAMTMEVAGGELHGALRGVLHLGGLALPLAVGLPPPATGWVLSPTFDRVSVGDLAALAASFALPDLADRFPAELAAALDAVAITGLRIHFQPLGRRLRAFALDLEVDTTWELVPGRLAIVRPTLALSILEPTSANRSVYQRLSALLRLGEAEVPVRVTSSGGAHTVEIEADDLPLPRFADLVALVGPAVELPVDLPALRLSGVSFGVDAQRRATLAATIDATLSGSLPGFPSVVMSGFHGELAVAEGALTGGLHGGLALGGATLDLAVERAESTDEWRFSASSTAGSGPLALSAALASLLGGVGLSVGLPDFNLRGLALAVTPKIGAFQFSATIEGGWTLPIGAAGLTIGDLRVAMSRASSGASPTCTITGAATLGGATMTLTATVPGGLALTATIAGMRPWGVIEALCGEVFDGVPIPSQLRDLVVDSCTLTIDPNARTLALAAVAGGFGAIELRVQRDANGAFGAALALALGEGADLGALLGIDGLGDVSLGEVVFVASSIHAPTLRFTAPAFAAVHGVTRGFGFAAKVSLEGLGVGAITGLPTAPLAVQARFGRTLADFSLAAAMAAPGARFVIDPASGLALRDPELRITPATGEVVIGGGVDLVLDGERLEFTGGVKLGGGSPALFATMRGDWRDPFRVDGVIARALALELPFPGLPSLKGTLVIAGKAGTLAVKPDPAAPVLDLALECLDLHDLLHGVAELSALVHVPAALRRTIADVRFTDLRVYVAPRATTIGDVQCPAGLSLRGTMHAWGLEVAARVETREVGGLKALTAEGAVTLPPLGPLTLRGGPDAQGVVRPGPYFKLDLQPASPPVVVIEAGVEVLGVSVAHASVHLDDHGFAIALAGPLFGGAVMATLEVRGGSLEADANFGVTATIDVGFLNALLGEAQARLTSFVGAANGQIDRARDLLTQLERRGQAIDASSESIRQEIKAQRAAAAAALRTAEASVETARARVSALGRELDAARATVTAERAAVQRRLDAAQRDVDGAAAAVASLTSQINATNRWFYGLPKVAAPWIASQVREGAWYGVKIGGLHAAREAAYGALDVARRALTAIGAAQHAFSIDLDPRVVGILAAWTTANEALQVANTTLAGLRQGTTLIPEDADFRLLALSTAREALNVQLLAARSALDLAEAGLDGLATLGAALIPELRIDRASFACDLSIAAGGEVRMSVDVTTHMGPRTFGLDVDLRSPLACVSELVDILLGSDRAAAIATVAASNDMTAENVVQVERAALPDQVTVNLRSTYNNNAVRISGGLRYGDTIALRSAHGQYPRWYEGLYLFNSIDAPYGVFKVVNPDAPGSTATVRFGDAVGLVCQYENLWITLNPQTIDLTGVPGAAARWVLVNPDDPNDRGLAWLDRGLALRGYNGNYFSVLQVVAWGGALHAIRPTISTYEVWSLVPWSAAPVAVVADGGWGEDFTLERSGDWVGLRSQTTGCFLQARPDGSVTAEARSITGPAAAGARFRLEGDYLYNEGQGAYLRLGDGATLAYERIPGSLKYVECGADGAVWGVNSASMIFRWVPSGGWDLIPGALRMVSVGSASQVWGVNDGNSIYRYIPGSGWTHVPGELRNVAVGADGTVWGVGVDDQIYRWNGASWSKIAGAARQVAVGSADHIWVVTGTDDIYRWNGSSWNIMPGKLRQISVAADGTVCGVNSLGEGWQWAGWHWVGITAGRLQIGVGSANLMWSVTTDLQIDRSDFSRLPGVTLDARGSTQSPRAGFRLGRAFVVNAIRSTSAGSGPPAYSTADVAVSALRKDALRGEAAAAEGPAAEAEAATVASSTRAIGDGAIDPVLVAEAAAEADRRARRQRMSEKAAGARPTIDEGHRDAALRFDGASYLELPAARAVINDQGVVVSAPTLALGASFTVEVWVRPERLGGGIQAIVSKWSQGADDGLLLALQGDGRPVLSWHVAGASGWGAPGWNMCTSSVALRLDAWAHVAVIREGDRIRLLVDGREVAGAVGLGVAPLHAGASRWRIGAEAPGSRLFVGLVDSLRVWDRAVADATLRARRFVVARGDEDGLLGCWNMDEASGDTTFDAGPDELHARLVGAVQRARPGGPEGPSLGDRHLALAGQGHVRVGDVDLLGGRTTATIEAWVLVDAVPGEVAAIVDKWDPSAEGEYLLGVEPGGRLIFAWKCEGAVARETPAWGRIASAEAVPFGRWCHVAVVRDGAWIRFYRDGAPIGAFEAATGAPFVRHAAPLCLGSEGGAARAFVGSLAEVRVWRVARGDAAIRESYRRPLVGDEAGLAALWRLDEGYGVIARDHGVDARHGEVVGAATWPRRGGPPRIAGPTRAIRLGGAHYLEFGDDDLFSASIAITLEAWVRLDALVEDFTAIVNKWTTSVDDEYLLAIAQDGRLAFAWHNEGATAYGTPGWGHVFSAGVVAMGRWTHVAVVRAGATVTFYLDGVAAGSYECADLEPLRNGAAPLRIGGHGPGVGRYLRGDLAGVRIWSVARAAEEIAASMSGLASSQRSGRVLDLRFDEGEGASIVDAASGRIGRAEGATPIAFVPVILPVRSPAPAPVDDAHDPSHAAVDVARRGRGLGRPASDVLPEVVAALAQVDRPAAGAAIAAMARAGYGADGLALACVDVWGHAPAAVATELVASGCAAEELLTGLEAVLVRAGIDSSEVKLIAMASASGCSPEALGEALARARGRLAGDLGRSARAAGLVSAAAARLTAAAMAVHAIPSPASLARLLVDVGSTPAAIGEVLARRFGADGSTVASALREAGGAPAAVLAAVQASFEVTPPPADRATLALVASLLHALPAVELGLAGGPEGAAFADDAAEPRRVVRIEVRHSNLVHGLRFTWETSDVVTVSSPWYGSESGALATIDLEADETIVKVSGRSGWWVDQVSFHTSAGRVFGPYGGGGGGPFAFAPRGDVVGLHGRAHWTISALGVATGSAASGLVGGGGGAPFVDDLTEVERIRRVTVRHDTAIHAIQLHTDGRDGVLVDGPRHGGLGGVESSFELADDERITHIGGRVDGVVRHLVFTTDRGNVHEFGARAGVPFSLSIEAGARLLGLCGRAGGLVDAIGVCVVPGVGG